MKNLERKLEAIEVNGNCFHRYPFRVLWSFSLIFKLNRQVSSSFVTSFFIMTRSNSQDTQLAFKQQLIQLIFLPSGWSLLLYFAMRFAIFRYATWKQLPIETKRKRIENKAMRNNFSITNDACLMEFKQFPASKLRVLQWIKSVKYFVKRRVNFLTQVLFFHCFNSLKHSFNVYAFIFLLCLQEWLTNIPLHSTLCWLFFLFLSCLVGVMFSFINSCTGRKQIRKAKNESYNVAVNSVNNMKFMLIHFAQE